MKPNETEPRSTLAALGERLSSFTSEDIRYPDPNYDVWDTTWPGILAGSRRERTGRLETIRKEVLDWLGSRADAFIQTSESPVDYDLAGDWHRVDDVTWRVPRGFDFREEAAQHWISLGSWTLYCAPAVVRIPDLFARRPQEVLDWLRRHRHACVRAAHQEAKRNSTGNAFHLGSHRAP